MNREAELRLIFSDVVKGYSKSVINSQNVYFKHLSSTSLSEVEHYYFESYENAIKEQIPTEKEKLKFLEDNNIWGKKQEDEIKKISLFLDGLKKSKSKQNLVSQRRMVQEQIDEQSKKLNSLKAEKYELIGDTAESIAEKKRTKQIVLLSSFCDPNLTKLFLNEDDADDDLLDESIEKFYSLSNKFNDNNLKVLSISSDFLMYFILGKDSAYEFYGKSIASLTFYQVQLFHHGRYFSELLKKVGDVLPFEVKNDPDKIVEWAEVKDNIDKVLNSPDSGGGQNFGVVGATKEDLKVAGLDKYKSTVDFGAEAVKKGGSLSMEDFMSLQGD